MDQGADLYEAEWCGISIGIWADLFNYSITGLIIATSSEIFCAYVPEDSSN